MKLKISILFILMLRMGSVYSASLSTFESFGYIQLEGQSWKNSNQVLSLKKGVKGFESEIDATSDMDGDGIKDLFDVDIDGDQVANYLDQFPFDASKTFEDIDGDQIPDFLDFSMKNESDLAISIQENIFKEKGIVIIHNGASFTDEQLQILEHELLEGALKNENLSRLLVIIKHHQGQHLAHYNKAWQGISFFNNESHKDSKKLRTTLVHEGFHAIALSSPEFFQKFFEKSGWSIKKRGYLTHYVFTLLNGETRKFKRSDFVYQFEKVNHQLNDPRFPSNYSKSGPEEMFAEAGVASYLLMSGREREFDQKRYHHLEDFKSTVLFDLFLKR